MTARPENDALQAFHPAVRAWFAEAFDAPTRPQILGWPAIARGDSTLILAPTGSGKTLAAFLWCLDRLMFMPAPPPLTRCRVLYVSPLKALAADVERNLRLPLAGIARMAEARGDPYLSPAIAVRTGDTPQAERARFNRAPADILITTPESLYLLLTSRARDALRSVDTIILDEIHALVPTKRGAHLALSLERLETQCAKAPQRIGLSATQRPLDEVARFLGGAQPPGGDRRSLRKGRLPSVRLTSPQPPATSHQSSATSIEREFAAARPVRYRPVTIVDAGMRKALALTIDVPVEEAAGPDVRRKPRGKAADGGPATAPPPSVWSAIHPRLLELIRAHRSTLIFVNSRRLAERLAGALNDLAGEMLVRSHHGSIAQPQRVEVEGLLKAGALRALVATSSLELGIDMGAIDLVVQIEAPPSVASGLQRIGRGGHQANAVSDGVIFPKFRGDLVACAAVAKAMHDGAVEATRFPRNPLDVLAQHLVAMASMDAWDVDALFATVRRAAPFAELSRSAFDGVLDMLSGRYPSDEFAELRPRITWDRIAGTIVGREGARRVAIANGGTIPDRGLYGVFLLGADRRASARVGELDEEMVFESRVGDTFVLGASSWRIADITHDRVLVAAAPGEPGKMPFWKGDRSGRPLELGLAIGRLTRSLLSLSPPAAIARLIRDHDLDARAAEHLLQYLRDQQAATRVVPDDKAIVIERVRDDLGDWRVCVLSPRGGRVHAPWAMAVAAKVREETGADVETLWEDDGFVVRFPDVDHPPDPRLLLPDPDEVHALVVRELGATALFAAKFRENAARSLLLPRRRAGRRTPLWQQRKRSADLLAVASRHGSFPVLLETYRECLSDFFDMPALVDTLRGVRSRTVDVATVDSDTPSPFAAAILYGYVARFLYDGDAPLAERRAQALAVDQSQLRELLGDAELRELLDAGSLDAVERMLQRLDARGHAKSADAVHDLLLSLGDLTAVEIGRRSTPAAAAGLRSLVDARRVLTVAVAREERYVAVEDAARFRDALDVRLPAGVPAALLESVRDPLGDLALRYARTHAPFTAAEFAQRYGLDADAAERVLGRLAGEARIVEGQFRPGGVGREWTDADVLRLLRRRSLARLRREVEPVDQAVLGRFTTIWQGVARRRQGVDALLDVIEQLQGAPLPASILETEILPARIDGYDPAHLDAVMAAGEVVWMGVETIGDRDGRVALYLADQVSRLLPPPQVRFRPDTSTVRLKSDTTEIRDRRTADTGSAGVRPPLAGPRDTQPGRDRPDRETAILDFVRAHGASFFGPLHDATGGGYPADTVNALWNLVWQGRLTNDTCHALRAFTRAHAPRRRTQSRGAESFRSRRLVPPSAEGRWTLVAVGDGPNTSDRSAKIVARQTAWAAAIAQQLLARHGVVTREAVLGENLPFGVLYPVFKGLEEAGRIRRGYFVAGLGATQFALPGALDALRSARDTSEAGDTAVLAATDPANPYGAVLPWPAGPRHPTRTVGATVILVNGALAAFLARGDRQLATFLPEAEPERSKAARAVSQALIERARHGEEAPRGMLIEEIDGARPSGHPLLPYLAEAGFADGAMGVRATFNKR